MELKNKLKELFWLFVEGLPILITIFVLLYLSNRDLKHTIDVFVKVVFVGVAIGIAIVVGLTITEKWFAFVKKLKERW